ncbi:MAG: hypothetical protein M3069_32190 [Chloroflexota bacterium]|nr:hypothetical protein [Chloroflexota bacterium]
MLGGFALARSTLQDANTSPAGDHISQFPLFLDESFLGRPHAGLLFGTVIGAWPMLDERYDGHPMLDYNGSCPNCPQLARAAQISVVRWGIWNAFEGMPPPSGQTAPPLTRAQFDSVIDGIRLQLGAVPLVDLPPGGSAPASLLCPEHWGEANLLELDRQIIRQAGSRVLLYELGNEPEIACSVSRDAATAGAEAAGLWTNLAPSLRKTARALGYEIYIGGPGFTTTRVNPGDDDPEDLSMVRAYMQTIKDRYEDPRGASFHDADLIPSFFSFHAYASEYLANGGARALDAIPRYAAYVVKVRATIDDVWGPTIGPHIQIACTEWNYAAESSADWSSPDVPLYYTRFLNMLRDTGIYLATQFLVGSNDNQMDMITLDGRPTPYYWAFKAASLSARSGPG